MRIYYKNTEFLFDYIYICSRIELIYFEKYKKMQKIQKISIFYLDGMSKSRIFVFCFDAKVIYDKQIRKTKIKLKK